MRDAQEARSTTTLNPCNTEQHGFSNRKRVVRGFVEISYKNFNKNYLQMLEVK
jgi:hypothetical protein